MAPTPAPTVYPGDNSSSVVSVVDFVFVVAKLGVERGPIEEVGGSFESEPDLARTWSAGWLASRGGESCLLKSQDEDGGQHTNK